MKVYYSTSCNLWISRDIHTPQSVPPLMNPLWCVFQICHPFVFDCCDRVFFCARTEQFLLWCKVHSLTFVKHVKISNIHLYALFIEKNSKINVSNFFNYFIILKFKMASKMATKTTLQHIWTPNRHISINLGSISTYGILGQQTYVCQRKTPQYSI